MQPSDRVTVGGKGCTAGRDMGETWAGLHKARGSQLSVHQDPEMPAFHHVL